MGFRTFLHNPYGWIMKSIRSNGMFSPLHTLLLLPLLLLVSTFSEAKIYQYTDASGRNVYVDRLSKVPAQYRDQLDAREESKDRLSTEALDALAKERDINQLRRKIKTERSKLQAAMKKWITPFTFHANRIQLPIKVVYGARSVRLNLVMDTGASFTVVHQSAIASLGAQLLDAGAARVANGGIVQTQRVNFDRVEIGPYKIPHVSAAVIDYQGESGGSQGLLGMDFLYNAQYELDRENQQIIWAPAHYKKLQGDLLELDKLEQRLLDETASPER
ncbi:MAG: putative aspartyl protease [Neptuniibacter pectenicola]|jgi:predicted aspartyl protease